MEREFYKIKKDLMDLECPLVESLNETDMYEILYKEDTSARYTLIKWLYVRMSSKFNRILNEYLPTDIDKKVENLVIIASTLGLCNMKNGIDIISGKSKKEDQNKFWIELLEMVKIENSKENISGIYLQICRILDKIINSQNIKNIQTGLFEDCKTYCKEYKRINYEEKLQKVLEKTNKMIEIETDKYKCTISDFENEKVMNKLQSESFYTSKINKSEQNGNYNIGLYNEKNNGIIMWDKLPICEIASLKKVTNETFEKFEQLIKEKFKPFLHHNMKNIEIGNNCIKLEQELLENINLNSNKYKNFMENITNTYTNILNIEKISEYLESDISLTDLPDDIIIKQLYNIFYQCSISDNYDSFNRLFKYDDSLWNLNEN